MPAAMGVLDANMVIDVPRDLAFAAPLKIATGLTDLLFGIVGLIARRF